MKKKMIIITALTAVLLAGCGLVVWALAWGGSAGAAAQTSPAPTVSPEPKRKPVVLPEFSYASAAPSAAVPAADESETPEPGAGETVTEDAEGNVTVQPNWSTDKLPEDANVVPRQPESNMAGGGVKLPTDKDGVYRGDQPAETPPPAPSEPTEHSVAPSITPSVETPSTPSAENGESIDGTDWKGDPGAPARAGHNGEVSPDGKYGWVSGFGWVERGGSNGGEGGNYHDPNFMLSGEKVGEM